MKWLVLAVLLTGCTAIYITGDSNSVTIRDTISTDANLEKKDAR